MASATAWRLHRAGFFRVLMTDIDQPLAVRRHVSFCEALHHGRWTVEGVAAATIESPEMVTDQWERRIIPVLVDPDAQSKNLLKPDVLIDAILAKKNLGTTIHDAPLVIGLGPGFQAGLDVHYAVETQRGHNLGRLITRGETSANTGIPGDIAGCTSQRVLRAPQDGVFQSGLEIGAPVTNGQFIGDVGGMEVRSSINGVLRGIIRSGTMVTRNLKLGDVDPRNEASYCRTISEKARAIGGTVLETILMRFNTA